jgi:integrase
MKRAGVPTGQVSGFTWHDGRHFFVSLLIAARVDPERIRKLVGHSSVAVTLKVYTHLWPQGDGPVRTALGESMRRVGLGVTGPVRDQGDTPG